MFGARQRASTATSCQQQLRASPLLAGGCRQAGCLATRSAGQMRKLPHLVYIVNVILPAQTPAKSIIFAVLQSGVFSKAAHALGGRLHVLQVNHFYCHLFTRLLVQPASRHTSALSPVCPLSRLKPARTLGIRLQRIPGQCTPGAHSGRRLSPALPPVCARQSARRPSAVTRGAASAVAVAVSVRDVHAGHA